MCSVQLYLSPQGAGLQRLHRTSLRRVSFDRVNRPSIPVRCRAICPVRAGGLPIDSGRQKVQRCAGPEYLEFLFRASSLL